MILYRLVKNCLFNSLDNNKHNKYFSIDKKLQSSRFQNKKGCNVWNLNNLNNNFFIKISMYTHVFFRIRFLRRDDMDSAFFSY